MKNFVLCYFSELCGVSIDNPFRDALGPPPFKFLYCIFTFSSYVKACCGRDFIRVGLGMISTNSSTFGSKVFFGVLS